MCSFLRLQLHELVQHPEAPAAVESRQVALDLQAVHREESPVVHVEDILPDREGRAGGLGRTEELGRRVDKGLQVPAGGRTAQCLCLSEAGIARREVLEAALEKSFDLAGR